MNNYTIYIHKNKINGKIYVGQTCQKVEYRWNKGKGYDTCPLFYKAIQKYGWDNFEHIILLENLTKEQADIKEQEYIKYYKSNQKEFGYNIQSGGNNHNVTEESRQKSRDHALKLWQDDSFRTKQSERMKKLWQNEEYRQKQAEAIANKPPKTISPENKQKMLDGFQKYLQENGHPYQGKHRSKQTCQKISEKMKGENNHRYGIKQSQEIKEKVHQTYIKNGHGTKVRCIETGEIFFTIMDAARWCGLKSSSSIHGNLKGEKKSAGKHPITKEKLHWELVKE